MSCVTMMSIYDEHFSWALSSVRIYMLNKILVVEAKTWPIINMNHFLSTSMVNCLSELRQHGHIQEASSSRSRTMSNENLAYSRSMTSAKFMCTLSDKEAIVMAKNVNLPWMSTSWTTSKMSLLIKCRSSSFKLYFINTIHNQRESLTFDLCARPPPRAWSSDGAYGIYSLGAHAFRVLNLYI